MSTYSAITRQIIFYNSSISSPYPRFPCSSYNKSHSRFGKRDYFPNGNAEVDKAAVRKRGILKSGVLGYD